jgi:hypothetical protein
VIFQIHGEVDSHGSAQMKHGQAAILDEDFGTLIFANRR